MAEAPDSTHHQDALISGIEEFASEYVANPRYQPKWPSQSKIVHDALWGTIRLHPWEIALLDLPLFQRLRQISQTSLVNYVFPGCRHSRFEHTLGVIHQTQKLAEAVNQLHRGRPVFDHSTLMDLRLAALFHDCGHSCFSHISENVYRHLPDMKAITAEGAEYASCHAHEVLGSLILRSEPVREYLGKVESKYDVQFRPERAANWIVGRHEQENLEYLTQVINGPFDADKLDYLFRDAHFSGLPLSVDLDRLWASCDLQRNSADQRTILTLHQASATPLEQILFSKINLFQVVSQPPKVRAAECMFQAAVDRVHEEDRYHIAGRKLQSASDFLWLTDSTFFAEALRRRPDDELHQMIHDILYRRHHVRALTITHDTHESDPAAYHELRRLNHNSEEDQQIRKQYAAEIWHEAGEPCEPYQVWLDLPPNPTLSGADDTYVRTSAGNLRKLTDLFPMHYWIEFYMDYKWRGHVFCPHHCQQGVYEAARRVFEAKLGLKFTKLAGESSHVPNP